MSSSRKVQTYEGGEVTVSFDPSRCIHSEECVRGLPAVFDPTRRRWIRPHQAAADDVVTAVGRCPSGALRATRRGSPVAEPPAAGETVVVVSHAGPLLLRGNLRVVDASGATIVTGDAAALCRCGGTANPPFCDGTHARIGFGTGESGTGVPA